MVKLADVVGMEGLLCGSDKFGRYMISTDLMLGVECVSCGNVLKLVRQYNGYWRAECCCGHVLFKEGWFGAREGYVF